MHFMKRPKENKKKRKAAAKNAAAKAAYISRARALKKLQVTLRDFRRLCILKGVYPRHPRKMPGAHNKTYYHAKDIAFLSHEPLLDKFREFKGFMKKVRKAIGRNERKAAQRMYDNARPRYSLGHLVKERYPRFTDSVADIDDAVCMVFLFAALPAERQIRVERTAACKRLALEWERYVVESKALRKVFVSVKGFYYQAEIGGHVVTWLVPFSFSQDLPLDVDFRVMLTFLEFYEAQMKFTMYRLYHRLGMRYPPAVHQTLLDGGAHLGAVRAVDCDRGAAPAPGINGDPDQALPVEGGAAAGKLADKRGATSKKNGGLFAGLVFYLNREVPRESLEFVILSFGGAVGWAGDGSPFSVSDPSITHEVVDRPTPPRTQVPTREYLQPQWVYDCVNAARLLPLDSYGPGSALPPHRSPFVSHAAELYPRAAATELQTIMMPKKAKRLFDRMQHGIQKRHAAAAAVAAKKS